jgi:hypothetical protein
MFVRVASLAEKIIWLPQMHEEAMTTINQASQYFLARIDSMVR